MTELLVVIVTALVVIAAATVVGGGQHHALSGPEPPEPDLAIAAVEHAALWRAKAAGDIDQERRSAHSVGVPRVVL